MTPTWGGGGVGGGSLLPQPRSATKLMDTRDERRGSNFIWNGGKNGVNGRAGKLAGVRCQRLLADDETTSTGASFTSSHCQPPPRFLISVTLLNVSNACESSRFC